MPQATNRQLARDKNNMPVGPGTIYNAMLKISAASRERAQRANEGERLRLGKITRVMDRHQRLADTAQSKVLERTQQQLKELQAFQVVLRDQFSVRNFHTLQPPSALPEVPDRRRRLETHFYSGGFSQKSMQPEIRRQLRRTDPERMRRQLKRHLLESSKLETHRLGDLIRKSLGGSHQAAAAHSASEMRGDRAMAISGTMDTVAIQGVAAANQVYEGEAPCH